MDEAERRRDRRPLAGPGPELDDLGADRRQWPRGHGRWTAPAALRGRLLGRGQEALEVAEAVAPVAALVDAVEAQPPLVAPGADRVGVDAEQACRLRDGERRVGRSEQGLRGGPPGSRPAVGPRRMEDR
jgi:hypothetical protein